MSETLLSCPQCQSPLREDGTASCPQCGAAVADSLATSKWYYAADKTKKGPVSYAELRDLVKAGLVGTTDMVLAAGSRQWQPAIQVPGLADTVSLSSPPQDGVALAESGLISLANPPAGADSHDLPTQAEGVCPAVPAETGFPKIPNYEITAELGRGGMGVVYKARQVQLKRLVALKMILAGDFASAVDRERFRAEAESVARLQHPNIVQIYEIGEHDNRPYFSLEYVAGGSLSETLGGAPQPPRAAAELIRVLALAMQVAHDCGIVHRDLKPANILLQPLGSQPTLELASARWGIPKIGDFGLAKQLDTEAKTASGTILGTPQYMAPEQARGQTKGLGPPADIYALGAILYQLLTGRPPFQGESSMDTLMLVVTTEPLPPSQLQPKLPRDLETICLKCLEKEPGKRYPSCAALADDLQRFLSDQPILARPISWRGRCLKWARRRPAVASLLVAIVVVTLVGFTGVLWQWRSAEGARANEVQARKLAEEETGKAKTALARAERNHYFHRVALAHLEWRSRRAGQVRRLLGECPVDLRDWEWRYLNRLAHAELATLPGTAEELLHVAWSADGRYLATAGFHSSVKIWDPASQRELANCRGHTGKVWRVAFSPDSRLLASGGDDKVVRIWDVPSGKLRQALTGHRDSVHGLSFNADGSRLASAGEDVRIWDVASGKLLNVLEQEGGSQRVAFHPSGDQLAAIGFHRNVAVWDLKTRKRTIYKAHDRVIYGVAYSPDGKYLATSSADQTVDLRDPISLKRLATLRGANELVSDVTFAPDSSRLAAASSDETVLVWELKPGVATLILRGHTRPAHGVAFHPDGRLASAGADGVVRFWDVQADPEVRIIPGKADGQVSGVAFAPNRRLFAAADWLGQVRIWDQQSFAQVLTLKSPQLSSAKALAFSPDSRLLAVGGDCNEKGQPPGVVLVYELKSGKPVQVLRLADNPVRCLAFSPDGTLFASTEPLDEEAGTSAVIQGWHVGTGQKTIQLAGHAGGTGGLACSSDGRLLASGGKDQLVRLWDLKTGQQIRALPGHPEQINAVALQPGGVLMASAGDDSTIKLWNVTTGQLERTLIGHARSVSSVAFTHDGKRLASGSLEGSVKLWDVATGQDVLTLTRHGGWVHTVAFSADGQFLGSGGEDLTVMLWHAP